MNAVSNFMGMYELLDFIFLLAENERDLEPRRELVSDLRAISVVSIERMNERARMKALKLRCHRDDPRSSHRISNHTTSELVVLVNRLMSQSVLDFVQSILLHFMDTLVIHESAKFETKTCSSFSREERANMPQSPSYQDNDCLDS